MQAIPASDNKMWPINMPARPLSQPQSSLGFNFQEHASHCPADVVNDMRREHSLQIGYWTAWRAKEAAFANINGSHESTFSQLPQYCEDIIRSNPGSTAILERTPDNHFLQMFVSYVASRKGFAYCQVVLSLDGSHLKSRYQGVLLAATAVDANGSLFPVSYAVVSAENDDNWSWFIDNLHNVIQMHAPTCLAPRMLAFISDRRKGLLEAVEKVFPGSPHGYCLRHLYENLHKLFKHKDLRSLLWEAALSLLRLSMKQSRKCAVSPLQPSTGSFRM